MTHDSLPADQLRAAADRWGTPLYLTDLDAAAANLAEYRAAFPGALIAYAVKANPDPRLLRRFAAEGAGAEVVNAVELALALRAGFPGERIVMNGIGKTDADHVAARDAGALVNVESLAELDALLAGHADRPLRLGLRLNPGLAADTHAHLATGAADSKFGIAWTDLDAAIDRCRAAGRPIESVGAHIGSAIDDVGAYARLAELLAEAAGRADADRINLGGGAGTAVSVSALADAVRPHLPDTSRLILEPGRSLVAEAGWLLTRVVRVQPRPEANLTYLVADAGMAELIRPALYGADHPVTLLEPGAALPDDPGTVHLAGPVCEAGDIVAHDIGRWLPAADLALTGAGALIGIGQAGAYGAAMASVYNGRPRPAEAVIDGGELALSRHRETVDDLIARDVDPADRHSIRSPAHRLDLLNEGLTMALYVSLSLLAVMLAFPTPDQADPVGAAVEIGLTAAGLILAHLVAFRLSARIVHAGQRTPETAELVVAQVTGGFAVTAVAILPFVPFALANARVVAELLLLAFIVVAGYAAARIGAMSRIRAFAYVGFVVLVVLLVLGIKSLVSH